MIGEASEDEEGWLQSLKGHWFGCRVQYINGGPLWVSDTAEPVQGGMSGSPVVSQDGAAIGVVTAGTVEGEDYSSRCEDKDGSPNPRLTRDLPGWLLAKR